MNVEFKFEIGQIVKHRLAGVEKAEILDTWKPYIKDPTKATATPLFITARLFEECPGGIQKFYAVRGNNMAEILKLHEEELEAFESV
jgi:hypothetical protein